jgi:hypothetical protein
MYVVMQYTLYITQRNMRTQALGIENYGHKGNMEVIT